MIGLWPLIYLGPNFWFTIQTKWFPPVSAKLYLQNSTLRLPQEPPRSLPRPTISDHNLFSPLPTHSPLPQPPHPIPPPPSTSRTLYPLRDNSMSNDPVAYPNIRFYIFVSSGIFLIPCSCCHIYPSMIYWWPITIIFFPIIDFAEFFFLISRRCRHISQSITSSQPMRWLWKIAKMEL